MRHRIAAPLRMQLPDILVPAFSGELSHEESTYLKDGFLVLKSRLIACFNPCEALLLAFR